jgi:hypothetical protein
MYHKYKEGDIVRVRGPKDKMGDKGDYFGFVGRVGYIGCLRNWYLLDDCDCDMLLEEWLEPYSEEDEDIKPEDFLSL